VGVSGERRLCCEQYRTFFSALRSFFLFLSPFSEAAICYRHPMLREGGGVWGVGLFAVYSAGRFWFWTLEMGRPVFFFLPAYRSQKTEISINK